MSRDDAVRRVRAHMESGGFLADLDRRVTYRTESQNGGQPAALRAYLEDELQPAFAALDFNTRLIESPSGKGPYLLAVHHESASVPTVLMYGHGDVVDGMAGEWKNDIDPWRATRVGDRVYGRGTADNKGQHSILMAGLRAVHQARDGRLGFNAKFIIETGEEIGSPDLRQVCETLREELSADLLLASDGPRLSVDRPTLFLGSRGGLRMLLDVDVRDGAHHSGNWGGVLANAGTLLAGAIASLVDARGRLLLDALKPPPISPDIRAALEDVEVAPTADEPALSPHWGEPGLSPAERLYAWNTLEVLAMSAGNIKSPANAIPGRAQAMVQLRFVVGTRIDEVAAAVQQHFERIGLGMVRVRASQYFAASRTDTGNPWVEWACSSIQRTTGKNPAVLPNFGGALPNDVFSEVLGLPTIWVPHSYAGCSQHAPDEHILLSVTSEALDIMAGLFWDLGETSRLS
jgi:acetylornithine deacetylase/succinyl-diaminopimelate desuccinylase-like protein